MFTIIAQKTTTSAATTSRIERKRRASSLIARAEPAKPKLKKAVSLSFSFLLRRKRVTRIFGCTIETNARDFLSLYLSLSFNQNRRILRLVVAVREATATSRRLRTRSKSAKVRVLEKKEDDDLISFCSFSNPSHHFYTRCCFSDFALHFFSLILHTRALLLLLFCLHARDVARTRADIYISLFERNTRTGLEGKKLEACYAQYGCDINIVTDHYAKVAGVEKKSQDEK